MQCSSTSNVHGFKFKIFRSWGWKNYGNNCRCHPGKHKKPNPSSVSIFSGELNKTFRKIEFDFEFDVEMQLCQKCLLLAVNVEWKLVLNECFSSKYSCIFSKDCWPLNVLVFVCFSLVNPFFMRPNRSGGKQWTQIEY